MIYQTRTARSGFSLMVEQIGDLGYLVSPAVDGLTVAGEYTTWCSTRAQAISTAELLMATYETQLGQWVKGSHWDLVLCTWDVETPVWASPLVVEANGESWGTIVIKDVYHQIPGKIGYCVLIRHNDFRMPFSGTMVSSQKAIDMALKIYKSFQADINGPGAPALP